METQKGPAKGSQRAHDCGALQPRAETPIEAAKGHLKGRGGSGGGSGRRDGRNARLARVHILKKELRLTQEQYEAVLLSIAGADTAAALDAGGLSAVIAHLQGLLPATQQRRYPMRPNNIDFGKSSELRHKVEALLTDASLPWAYAMAVLKRQTKGRVERIEFAADDDLRAVIAALDHAARRRLSIELSATLGPNWKSKAAALASTLFQFNSTRCDIAKSAQAMSQVARYLRCDLQPYSEWPRQWS